MDADAEAAATADTFRAALGMIRAARDGDTDAWWALYEGVPPGLAPVLARMLSLVGALHRDDAFFAALLARIGQVEASGELAARSRNLLALLGLG